MPGAHDLRAVQKTASRPILDAHDVKEQHSAQYRNRNFGINRNSISSKFEQVRRRHQRRCRVCVPERFQLAIAASARHLGGPRPDYIDVPRRGAISQACLEHAGSHATEPWDARERAHATDARMDATRAGVGYVSECIAGHAPLLPQRRRVGPCAGYSGFSLEKR